MKISATLFTVLFVGQASAKWNACGFGDYKEIYMSLAQGVGEDITKTDTDCIKQSELLGKQTEQLFNSFKNFDVNDWAKPLYEAAELSTKSVSVFTACQTTNLAKQFSVRANSLSGVFDLVSTVGVAFLMEKVTKPGKSDLYNAFVKVNDAESCQETAMYFGRSVALLFSYDAQPKEFINQLPQDLVENMK